MIGKTISHYRILEKLGEGAMGVVYKAEDAKLRRAVALKFLLPGSLAGPEERARFLREAQAAAALRHPNICSVFEIDEVEGRTFIVMEYVEGESLSDKLASGTLSLNEAARVVVQIAEALEHAHEKGVVHRDVKTANVMLTARGDAVLTDFGLAKADFSAKVTETGTTVGTAAYMSPEQARGKEVDQRTDIWSLGVVFYELITGTLPFKGEFAPATLYSILNEEPTPPRAIRAELPAELESAALRAIQKDPDKRFQSAREFGVAIARWMRAAEGEEHGAEAPGASLRRLRRPAIAVPVALIGVCAILALAYYVHRSQRIRWARNEALPEVMRLIEADDNSAAYLLASRIEKVLPSDPVLSRLLPELAEPLWVSTSPQGAEVLIRDYSDPKAAWIPLGRTPIDSVLAPPGGREAASSTGRGTSPLSASAGTRRRLLPSSPARAFPA
jgi:predicted Ser/Thr protein kinase